MTLTIDQGFFPLDLTRYRFKSDYVHNIFMNSKFEKLQYNKILPNNLSVLYRIKTNIHAILKYFSRKTSYIHARLAFHRYSKFIREYCNNHRFVPSLIILISFKLILNRSHGFGSYFITLIILLKFAFTMIRILRNKITRKSIIPKVRCHLLTSTAYQ